MSFWIWLGRFLDILQIFKQFRNWILRVMNMNPLYSNMSIDRKRWSLLVPVFENLDYKNCNRERIFKLEYQEYIFSWFDNQNTGIMVVKIRKAIDINSHLNWLRGIASMITQMEGWPEKIKILLVTKRKQIPDKWHHIIFGNVNTAILSSYSFDLLKDIKYGEVHIKRILENLNGLE